MLNPCWIGPDVHASVKESRNAEQELEDHRLVEMLTVLPIFPRISRAPVLHARCTRQLTHWAVLRGHDASL